MVWQQFQKTLAAVFSHDAVKVVLGFGFVVMSPVVAAAAPETFFYSTTTEAGQMGHEYMVMEVSEDQTVKGAVYQVNSEFACFSGEVAQGKLNLAIIDPYEQVAYEHQMNYNESQLIADAGDRSVTRFIPEGFYLIDSLSEIAERVLGECLNDPALVL